MEEHHLTLALGAGAMPRKILFNADGETGFQGAVDAIRPAALVRITIVGIQDRAIVIKKVE
jgi:hypothetical protein